MNQEFDQIFDQAIEMLAQGESVEFVVQQFPEHKEELLELLPIVTNLNSIAISEVPAPTRHYRFTEASWSWVKLGQLFATYKFAMAPLLLVIIVAAGFSVNKASNASLPGQVLYSLKSAKEQAQVTLTFDQKKLATLHVELAQKRLDEVKKAAETNNSEAEVAALTKLAEQTEKTLTAVSQVATDPATETDKQELLDNLVAINKEQKTLIQAAAESSDTKTEATVALNESKETDINLAKLIATVNEQTLLDLPNKVSVTGVIASITDRKVLIEKSTFNIDDQTVIVGATGEVTTSSEDLKGKVTVIGTSENNILIAKRIVIIDPTAVIETEPVTKPTAPQVKGQVTPKPATTNIPKPATTDVPPVDNSVVPPAEAYGGFIAEPANSQYLQ